MLINAISPDGLIIVEAVVVSAVIAVLAWRRVRVTGAAIVTVIAAIVLPIWQQAAAPSAAGHELFLALFIVVPTAVLLGVSRARWIAHHAWLLILVGPLIFVGCFVGICELCAKAGLLS